MPFNYKDLTYIRAALQEYQGSLKLELEENDNLEDEVASEMENDLLYIGRLIALVNRDISDMEGGKPQVAVVVDNKD